MTNENQIKRIRSETSSRLVELAGSAPRVEDISEGDVLDFRAYPADWELVASKKTYGEGEKTYEFTTYRLGVGLVEVKEYVSSPGLRELGANLLFIKIHDRLFPENEKLKPVFEKLMEVYPRLEVEWRER